MPSYPTFGATYLSSAATAAAGAATATLSGAAGLQTFITGFTVTGTGATTQAAIAIQVLGIAGTAPGHSGTAEYRFQVATGGTAACTPLQITFNPPHPAAAQGSAITVVVPSFGSGNLQAAVTAFGFRQ